MSEAADRMRGKKVVKPIVYGNTATPFGFKRESDNHTHTWTVFVKPYYNEDVSLYIRKVQFKLHESYAVPTRTVEKPPFEVTETGWGEFEVQMRIYFTDLNEKPITAFHYLRLFQPIISLPDGSPQVVSEYYDEIVFQEPSISFYKNLLVGESKKPESKRFKNHFVNLKKHTLETVSSAQEEIRLEIDDLRDSLREAHRLLIKYNIEGDDSAQSTPRASISM